MSYNYSQDPEEQLPDWLKALRNQERDEPEADKLAPEGNKESVEDSDEALSPEAEPELPEEAGKDDEPEWLSEIRQRQQQEGKIEDGETPEEIEDTRPQQALPSQEETVEKQGSFSEQLSEDIEGFENPESSQPEGSDLAPGEVPSWLEALRPAEAGSAQAGLSPGTQPSPSEEQDGPLAGLSGVLPAEPEITQIGMAKSYTGQLEISRSQRRHRATLEEMLAGQSESGEKISRQVPGLRPWPGWLIASALLVASLIPLLGASERAPLPAADALPEGFAVYSLIEALPESASVFIAFEVEPSLYGEMEIVVSTVIGHLIEKEAKINFLSTLPTGPALADRLMIENFGADEQYLNLGYLSGGMAAMRHFASHPRETNLLPSLWNALSLQAIEVLSDFALILIVSSDAENARSWIEQVGPQISNDMIAATSAQASPLLYAYLQSDPATLKGLIGGMQGAAMYEKLREQDGPARNYWDAYSYTLGATVLLILVIGLRGRLVPAKAPGDTRGEKDDKNAA